MSLIDRVIQRVVKSTLKRTLHDTTSLSTAENGIHLDFSTSVYYRKTVGQDAIFEPFTTMFTFTGGNQSMYRGATGLLVASATNTPRIEYDANGNCLGLLMEAARTNLCLQSQVLATTWGVTGVTISSNAATAPDNTVTADKVQEDTSTSQHINFQSFTKAASSLAYTYSIWVKAAERSFVILVLEDGSNGVRQWFNLTTGAVGSAVTFGTGFTKTNATIESYASGWYRISLSVTSSTSTTLYAIQGVATADASYTHNGVSGSGAYFYGAQLEQAAFASSYIPTTTAAVARTADSCVRTLGAEFSATGGTVVVAGRASGGQSSGADDHFWSFDDGTTNEVIRFFRVNLSNSSQTQVRDGSVTQSGLNATLTNSTAFKNADAWALNDFSRSFNGAAVTTDTGGTLPTITTLRVGSGPSTGPCNGHILRFDYYPKRENNGFLERASAL